MLFNKLCDSLGRQKSHRFCLCFRLFAGKREAYDMIFANEHLRMIEKIVGTVKAEVT